MSTRSALPTEMRRLVEARMDRTLKGIEETLHEVLKNRVNLEELKSNIKSLGQSFALLSQKWNLEILYTLFLKDSTSFSELKKILGINSRTLSDKLKSLTKCGYIHRRVKTEPPLRVEYALATRGKNTVLLALPLLYYSQEP